MSEPTAKKTTRKGRQAEADDATHLTIEWPGLDPFDVPVNRDDWSLELCIALEYGQEIKILQGFMGQAAFRQFRATRPTRRQAVELSNHIASELGLIAAGE